MSCLESKIVQVGLLSSVGLIVTAGTCFAAALGFQWIGLPPTPYESFEGGTDVCTFNSSATNGSCVVTAPQCEDQLFACGPMGVAEDHVSSVSCNIAPNCTAVEVTGEVVQSTPPRAHVFAGVSLLGSVCSLLSLVASAGTLRRRSTPLGKVVFNVARVGSVLSLLLGAGGLLASIALMKDEVHLEAARYRGCTVVTPPMGDGGWYVDVESESCLRPARLAVPSGARSGIEPGVFLPDCVVRPDCEAAFVYPFGAQRVWGLHPLGAAAFALVYGVVFSVIGVAVGFCSTRWRDVRSPSLLSSQYTPPDESPSEYPSQSDGGAEQPHPAAEEMRLCASRRSDWSADVRSDDDAPWRAGLSG